MAKINLLVCLFSLYYDLLGKIVINDLSAAHSKVCTVMGGKWEQRRQIGTVIWSRCSKVTKNPFDYIVIS